MWSVCHGMCVEVGGISLGVILLSLSEAAYLLFGLLCGTLRTRLAHELLAYSSVSAPRFAAVILGLWIHAATSSDYLCGFQRWNSSHQGFVQQAHLHSGWEVQLNSKSEIPHMLLKETSSVACIYKLNFSAFNF